MLTTAGDVVLTKLPPMSNIANQLYPSILTESQAEAAQQLLELQELPEIQTVQIDVIDGFFADNLTITPDDLLAVDFGELTIDFHLMVNEPVDFVLEAAVSRSHLPIRAIIAQAERMGSQAEYLDVIKANHWLPGLSLDLHTPLEAIDDESWAELKVLQFMGNTAGYRGQPFVSAVLDKVKTARQQIKNHQLEIEVVIDVGVRITNVKEMIKAGVNSVVVGSELWQAEDQANLVAQYYEILNQ